MTNNNVVYQNGLGAKHYKNFSPLYNFGKSVALGKYGSMAMEYLKENEPMAYEAYSEYREFKYILAGINDEAAKRFSQEKLRLKSIYPTPKTDDFFKLAEHNANIERMAERIVLREVVYKPHIRDEEVIRAQSARYSKANDNQ